MKKLNVIDLDKTLIPFDSYRLLLIREIKKFDVRVISLVLRRLSRTMSLKKFKHKSIIYLQKKYKQSMFDGFALEMLQSIDPDVMKLITEHSDDHTINVLISASPDFYVKRICSELNWQGAGSYIDEQGSFVHLYDVSKLSYVNKMYPTDSYEYNFSISDSSTDDELLSKFKTSKKWISQ